MNRQPEQESSPNPQRELVIGHGCLRLFGETGAPIRVPIRSNDIAVQLLTMLVWDERAGRVIDPDTPDSWVPRERLLHAWDGRDAVCRADNLKKGLKSARLLVDRLGIGSIESSGDGQYRFAPADGVVVTVQPLPQTSRLHSLPNSPNRRVT